jgi:hypothetical protein
MKKSIVVIAFFLLAGTSVLAQGIGTTSPNADAALDISSTTKGLLPPRVALSATNLASPLSAHVAGMLVYNTATAGSGNTAVVPGIYVNDGTKWYLLTTGAASGGGTCGSYTVSFTYNGASVTYGTLASPTTAGCYLDRNLGAAQVATAYNDFNGYGDLIQWGRGADGHQLMTWSSATAGSPVNGTTATLSTTDVPGNALFIIASSSPNDWRSGQNNNLWQGVSGINNPCPSGWRLPTQPEWAAETGITNYNTAYSQLKLTTAGLRNFSTGSLSEIGSSGDYWSSTPYTANGTPAYYFYIISGSADPAHFNYRAMGFSVRCRK